MTNILIAASWKNAASELGRSSFFVVLRRRQHVLWPIYPSPRPREGFDGVRRASAVAYLFTEKGAECSGAVQGPLSDQRTRCLRSTDLSAGVSDYVTLAAPTVIRIGYIMVTEHVG